MNAPLERKPRGARRVLVTGGAGFIGSHVTQAYLDRGDDVWVVDDLSSGRREKVPDGAEFIEMDIRSRDLGELFRDVGFDLVNHHAAQIDVRVSVADPRRDAETNLLGLLNLTEAVLKHGAPRLIFISSGGAIYGDQEIIPTPESVTKNPMSPYGVTKFAGELYLNYYRNVHALDCVALRYSNVYGPGQDPSGEAGVIAIFIDRILDRQPILIFGDGEQTRDYVFVHDVVAANMLVSDLPESGPGDVDLACYNVGTGVATSVNQLAEVLEEIGKVQPNREYRPGRPGELAHSTVDPSRIRDSGWRPQHSLPDGLAETFAFIAGARAG